jgi:hypothetical protein
LNTNTFSSWDLEGGALTSGFTAPDSTSTAYKYVQVPGGGLYSGSASATSGVKTASVWLKSVSGTSITCILGDGDASNTTVVSVTGDWQLFTATYTTATSRPSLYIYAISNASGIYVWHPQLNIGSTAKPYFPTTDRLNVPRLTYQNGGGGCPSLLLEKQSTNIVFPSEDFSTTWSAINTTVTTNQATAPDGNTTADRISITSNGGYIRRFNLTTANSSTYTASVYVKNDTISAGNTFNFYFNNNLLPPNSAEGFATININSGTVTSSSGGSGISNVSASIESLINGWYRVNLTFTLGSLAGGNNCEIGFTASTATRTFFAWGAQIEASSYPTSYIPTTSASATRVADLSTSDTIQTAQTFAGDFTFFVDFVSFTTTDGVGPTNQMIIGGGNQALGASYKSYFWITQNAIILTGDNEASIIAVAKIFNANQRYKLLVKRNGTTVKIFCDGVQVGSSATSSLSITIRSIGWAYNTSYIFNGLINQVVLSATGFSDADCQSLTTI